MQRQDNLVSLEALESIPEGWFGKLQSSVIASKWWWLGGGRKRLSWQCELKSMDGALRCVGSGGTPDAAIASAVEQARSYRNQRSDKCQVSHS